MHVFYTSISIAKADRLNVFTLIMDEMTVCNIKEVLPVVIYPLSLVTDSAVPLSSTMLLSIFKLSHQPLYCQCQTAHKHSNKLVNIVDHLTSNEPNISLGN